MELVSEALEARTYFLEDAIVGPKSRDIIGAGGAVSISSYAGGGPRPKMPYIHRLNSEKFPFSDLQLGNGHLR